MEHIKSKIEILKEWGVDIDWLNTRPDQVSKILDVMEVYKNESLSYAPVPICQPVGMDIFNIQSEETDSAIYEAKYKWLDGFRIEAVQILRAKFGWSLIECRDYCIKNFK